MKSLIKVAAFVAVLAAPIVSFAQSSEPVSRAQVRAELIQVEKAGYNPGDWIHYPENIQAAEARVAAQNGTVQADHAGYGEGATGTSESGRRGDMTESTYSPPVSVVR
ncbi:MULTISPECIES: DUF4148 domain-containing protein [Paraburkholderia]|uniref:DUF4148 domain-containing protein n=1 Tax=Paraburkholderia madseniana TaxID=2599607 RepID=A0AAP5B9X2_9BURK|nr:MULTISPECIES: DUF4148 domain-containing protein [Paraburkholderia]MCX4145009.1 DUF4148 domain-containing protein [Paraburkholderia madseniana]MDN7147961.1 DUF4148 domain-containing protein [Paraburkholderia sp. WS6]MDQ6406841.1 DUF4148 domain-containing protein [Paraburkholderia madseniana]